MSNLSRAWFLARIKKLKGCWVWQRSLSQDTGYGQLTFNNKHYSAHRFAYEFFIGPIPQGLFVLHRCDNRACIRPQHLFAGTQLANVRDAVRKGRHPHGERLGHAKITGKDALAIREDPRLHRVIAKAYGLSRAHVTRIKSGTYWKHL